MNIVNRKIMIDLNELRGKSFNYNINLLMRSIDHYTDLNNWVYQEDYKETIEREQAVINYIINKEDNFKTASPRWIFKSKQPDYNEYYGYLKQYTNFNGTTVYVVTTKRDEAFITDDIFLMVAIKRVFTDFIVERVDSNANN